MESQRWIIRLVAVVACCSAGLGPAAEIREVGTLEGHTGELRCVAYSPDGKTIATGGMDMVVRLFDADTRKLKQELPPHKGPLLALAFSPDGKLLAASDEAGIVRMYELAMKKAKDGVMWGRMIWGNASYVNAIGFSDNGKVLAAGGNGATIMLFEPATGNQAQLGYHSCDSLAFIPGTNGLASAGGDGHVKLWNLVTRKVQSEIEWTDKANLLALPAENMSVVFPPGGKAMFTATGSTKLVQLWNPLSVQKSSLWQWKAEQKLRCLAVSKDGKFLAAGTWDPNMLEWTSERKKENLILLDAKTGTKLAGVGAHPQNVWGVAISPDGKSIATASIREKVARVWDVTGAVGK